MARKCKHNALKEKALSYLQTAISSNYEIIESHREGLEAYMSQPYGDEVEGRSKLVMSDVQDTIEWIMPSLMKVFYGGTRVVDVKPQGPEDEEKAKLMEEKVNFDFQRGINGYTIMDDWFKSALLGKYSAVKYWWEISEEKEAVEFTNLSQLEIEVLMQNDDFEIEAVEETVVVDEMSQIPEVSFNVSGYKIIKTSKPNCKVLPPEEFIFNVDATGSIKEADFVAHKKRVHKNHVKSKYKIKERDIEKEVAAFDTADSLKDTRFEDLGGIKYITDDVNSDFVYLYECYLNDYDSEGEPIPKKVVMMGEKILSVEDNTYGHPPFCGLTTIRIPHRAAGRSMAEIVTDIQKLKTYLMRAILDNMYYQNNAITVVNPYRINMDDVIDRNEPGAKWRTRYDIDPSAAIHTVQPHAMAPQAYNLLEIVESIKEKKTGVTSYNQGLDSKSLNKTATGISQIMGAAQQRVEMIARNFAETGVRELFQAFVDMNLRFYDGETSVKLNDKWVEISADAISGKFDIILDAGVGTGTNEVKIGQLMNMINVSAPGMERGIITDENYANLLTSIYELMGYKNTSKFVGGEQSQASQQAQQAIQELQGMVQQLQSQLQEEQTKNDIEEAKFELEKVKLALKEKEVELKYMQSERDSQRDFITNQMNAAKRSGG